MRGICREVTGVGDQYSGECERGAGERVETKGGVAGAGPGSDVTAPLCNPKADVMFLRHRVRKPN